MSGMNEFLSRYYKTASQEGPSEEDLQKQASVELFAKMAASKNIDIASLPEAEIRSLYNDFLKTASEEGKKEEKKEEIEAKKEEAKKELEEKKAAAEKLAEADFIGRQMAHAYVDELKKIASEEKEKKEKDEKKEEPKEEGKKEEGKLPPFMHKKASALDTLAAQHAIKIASEAGYNAEEATERLSAVLTLGPLVSEKTAGMVDVDAASGVRALELLEQAGYPVSWK